MGMVFMCDQPLNATYPNRIESVQYKSCNLKKHWRRHFKTIVLLQHRERNYFALFSTLPVFQSGKSWRITLMNIYISLTPLNKNKLVSIHQYGSDFSDTKTNRKIIICTPKLIKEPKIWQLPFLNSFYLVRFANSNPNFDILQNSQF